MTKEAKTKPRLETLHAGDTHGTLNPLKPGEGNRASTVGRRKSGSPGPTPSGLREFRVFRVLGFGGFGSGRSDLTLQGCGL